jgi:hypothetical protein
MRCQLVFQSSDARQLRGTSYAGSMSVTLGARSASAPPPPAHAVGIAAGFDANSAKSASGTALPTHDSSEVLPGSPVLADASARSPGRSRSRNSPMPPRTTPAVVR